MSEYDKPLELYAGLRLHQNENTIGCSPRVLAALAAMRSDQVAFYPPYRAVTEACAKHFGVAADHLTLVNGLDEGILAAAVAQLRSYPAGTGRVVVPEPAFEVFGVFAEAAGGLVVSVMPRPDFAFPLDEVLAALTPDTRLVFITNPNNPTGIPVTRDTIKTVARRLPPAALLFVDEAYADFSDSSFIPDLAGFPNVIVGRTFSKAFGLAGLRIGAIVGAPATLEPLRRVIPVYSVNAAAVAAVGAALTDLEFVARYLEQVQESKTLVYLACERLGLQYWKSAANFVLIRVGPNATAVVEAANERGIYLRDRSSEPGCEGCIRMTTGSVEHTRRGVAVLEEVLCATR